MPDSTTRIKPLHKSEFFEHFGIKGKERTQFDAEVAKMSLVAHVSPATIPAFSTPCTPQTGRARSPSAPHGFWVLRVDLKVREASPFTIELLASNIRQRLVFALQRGDETQFAVQWNRLLKTPWMKTAEAVLSLRGRDAESAWLGVVAQIGGLEIDSDMSREECEAALERQIIDREWREKVLAEIARLEKACARERQMRRRYELHRQIQQLKSELIHSTDWTTKRKQGQVHNEEYQEQSRATGP